MRPPPRLSRQIQRTTVAHVLERRAPPVRVVDAAQVAVPRHDYLSVNPAPAPPEDNPHVDYGRTLTVEGGILITYKDIDDHLRHTLWRILAWTAASWPEGSYLLHQSPVHDHGINVVLLIVMAAVNWVIVAKPVEVYRTLEIRPDCMIIEGKDVFWRRQMENGWPSFMRNEDGHQVLSGIYGTRFVEYLVVRRFDEYDRTPEVFAAHLQDAMRQLWTNHF